MPLLEGTLAHFVCRNVRQLDAGDHVIFSARSSATRRTAGEPLVFHSGFYRVATRHAELDQP